MRKFSLVVRETWTYGWRIAVRYTACLSSYAAPKLVAEAGSVFIIFCCHYKNCAFHPSVLIALLPACLLFLLTTNHILFT